MASKTLAARSVLAGIGVLSPACIAAMLLLPVSACFRSARADDELAEESQREQYAAIIRDYVSRHRLVLESAPDKYLEPEPDPLLYWTNPTRARFFGGIYIWTQHDRPVAFCGIHLVEDDGIRVSREFHSLARESFQVEFDREAVWTPEGPGVEFQVVSGAGQPAGTSAARLRQMKAIASQFSFTISLRDRSSERLRALPRPIYRQAETGSESLDGAVIAFVQGTDPEAMLLIEARENDGELQWYYAIARCTSWSVTAVLDGETVYEVPPYYGSGERPISAPFFCLHRRPLE